MGSSLRLDDEAMGGEMGMISCEDDGDSGEGIPTIRRTARLYHNGKVG